MIINGFVVSLCVAWLSVGIVAGWVIGFTMGCRKRGDYTK